MHAEFPTTGQPIRVVIIDDEPWFATMDICRVLGRRNPSDAVKNLHSDETRTVDMRTVCLAQSEAYDEPTGRNAYGRGNQTLNLVNESGLYKLVLRSDKPTARLFQDWVTRRLLFTSVVRHLLHRSHRPLPEPDITVSLGSAELRGRARALRRGSPQVGDGGSRLLT